MDLTNPFGGVIEEIRSILEENQAEFDIIKSVDEKFCKAYDLLRENQTVQENFDELLISSMENEEKKNIEKSIKMREEGNKLFREGKFSECLTCYNNSILLAPCSTNFELENESIDFAMSLTNRAAILGKFKMHKNAAEDLEVAIISGYPKHLLYKAYQRLGVAYEGLGDQMKATNAYEKLIEALDYSDIPNEKIKKMKNDASFALKSLDSSVTKKEHCWMADLKLINNHNEIKTLSSSIEIRQTAEKGRYAVAREKIEVGEIVSNEMAIASSMVPRKRRTHCLHCCRETICPLPCAGCCTVGFCSRECRREGMIVHQYECKISGFLANLPLKISQMTTQFLVTVSAVLNHPMRFHLEVFDNWKSGVEPNREDKEATAYFSLQNLVKHFDNIDLLEHFAITLTLLKFLKNLKYYSDDIENENELKLGQVLCHYFAAVMPNIHAIFEMSCKPKNPTITDMLAVALFPNVASHVNHSCDPNTFVIDQGRVQITVAARNIQPGEEISHVYFGHFGDTSKEKRQEHLLKKYHFKCTCDACENDYPNAEKCLEIANTFASTPKENLLSALSHKELEDLDTKNDELKQMVESALRKNMVPLALGATKNRIKLISEHLKQPHILYVMGRCSIVNYMWYIYGNRSNQFKPGTLPCYF